MPAGRTQLVHLNTTFSLGALGFDAVISQATKIDNARQQGIRLLKVKGTWDADGKTANEGPVVVGFNMGLAATEVAEAFVADPQIFEDAGASEQANRKCYPVASIPYSATGLQNSGTGQLSNSRWWDQRVPSWEFPEGRGLNLFAINRGAANLTTGTTIRFVGVAVTKWLDD